MISEEPNDNTLTLVLHCMADVSLACGVVRHARERPPLCPLFDRRGGAAPVHVSRLRELEDRHTVKLLFLYSTTHSYVSPSGDETMCRHYSSPIAKLIRL